MSTQPQREPEQQLDFTRPVGKLESVCMHCFETLRASTESHLELMEKAHPLDCPQRPIR
jgi:hypothetical protein